MFVCHSKPKILIEGNSEPELRLRHALLGGAPHAALVFQIILICTLPADPIFRGSVTLVGRFLVPVSGFFLVETKQPAGVVNPAQPILRFRVARFSHGEKRLPVSCLQGGQTKDLCKTGIRGKWCRLRWQKNNNEKNEDKRWDQIA